MTPRELLRQVADKPLPLMLSHPDQIAAAQRAVHEGWLLASFGIPSKSRDSYGEVPHALVKRITAEGLRELGASRQAAP